MEELCIRRDELEPLVLAKCAIVTRGLIAGNLDEVIMSDPGDGIHAEWHIDLPGGVRLRFTAVLDREDAPEAAP